MADPPNKRGRNRQVVAIPVSPIRECAVCHEDRVIVSHGLCNRCHLRQKRANDRLLYTPASAVTAAKGTKNLSALYALMESCRVTSDVQRMVLEALLPFMGLPRDAQEGHLKSLKKQGDVAALDEDGRWDVHDGSSLAPDDSMGREPEF